MASNNGRPNNPQLFSPNGGAWKRSTTQQPEKVKNSPNHDNHKKQVVIQLSELFGKVLDREIISSVALNCNWDVDSAIEALIEISKDANMPTPSKPNNTRGNSRPRDSPVNTPALKAIKIAYQGYDDSSDDADVLVEEEEEFEVVGRLPSVPPGCVKPKPEAKIIRKVSHSPTLTSIHESISRGIKILILMRGVPGSGKSFTARQVLANSLDGVDPGLHIFSTDDYFSRVGRYAFEPHRLPEAHDWNRRRVSAVMQQGRSPVFVDNTNTEGWEMKPYVHLATQYGYAIELLEPNTPWCWKEAELAQRNLHSVKRQTIRSMLERYEKCNVSQLLSQSKLKYAYGNVPPQRCTNPPKPKAVRARSREAASPRKKGEVEQAQPTAKSKVNEGVKVGDEAGYYGPLPGSPVAAQNNNNNNNNIKNNTIVPQKITPFKPPINHTTQLLLKEIKPMQQMLPSKVIKETRTEGMEQFLSKLPLEISVQKLVHVEQLVQDKPVNLEQAEEVPNKEITRVILSDLLVGPNDKQASLISSNKLELKNPPHDSNSLTYERFTEEEKLKVLDQEVDEEIWEKFLNHKVGDNVDASLPEEVKVDPAGILEAVSITGGAVSPCWEYSLIGDDNEIVHQKQHDVTVNKTDDLACQSTDAQTIPSMPVMKTLSNIEKVMDRLPQLGVSADQMLTCSSIEQSNEAFVSEPPTGSPVVGNDVKGTALPKLNLFSWLFPKKTAELQSLESSVQDDTSVSREPWQLYRPPDDDSNDNNSLLMEPCKLECTDNTQELSGIMKTLKEVREMSPKRVDDQLDSMSECLPNNVTANEDRIIVPNDAVENNLDSLMGPVSFLLDAIDFNQTNVNIPDNTTPEVIAESNEMVGIITESEFVPEIFAETSNVDQVNNESIAPIITEHSEEVLKTTEECSPVEPETTTVNVTLDNESNSVPENLLENGGSEVVSPVTANTSDAAVSQIETASDNVEACPEPSSNVVAQQSEESIPDISSNINMDCWAKLNPTYLLSEEGAHMVPAHPKPTLDASRKRNETRDCGTNTAHSDFSSLDSDLPVLTAYSRSINVGTNISAVRPLASVYMLDKGSMTSPVDIEPGQYDFELLVNMFPKIPTDDLMEVFEKCQREINWTVDVLLESGYAFEPSEDLEIRFGDTEELQQSQDLLEELNSRDSSLMKPDVVESSMDALSNSPKRYTQLEEFKVIIDSHLASFDKGEDVLNIQQPTESALSPGKKPAKKQSKLTLQLKKQMEDSFVLSEDSYSEETLRIKKIRHGEFPTYVRTESPAANVKDQNLELPKIPDSQPNSADFLDFNQESEEEEEGSFQLTLDSDFLKQLQLFFGEVAFPYPDGVSPVVDLPVAISRQIHGYLLESQQKQLEVQETYFENMIKDEEFARRLQEEELPPPDFRQIMDMEMALELYRTDASNVRRETKEDMATRLSKQKLFELFPRLDRDVLTDVFAAHDNSFADTLEVLEASTGEPEEEVRNVMSPEAMLAYEKQLIDRAKQESRKQCEDAAHEPSPTGAAGPVSLADRKEQAMDDAKYYREEAHRLVQLRNECYQKANSAHRDNQAAVASYYAQVGHLYKQRIEEANSRAASALLSAQAQRSTTLDLHYLRVAEALEALDIFLDYHIASLADGAAKSEALYVITGSGLHSVGGKPRIRPAVQARLAQRRVRYFNVNSGLLKVAITRNLALSNGNR